MVVCQRKNDNSFEVYREDVPVAFDITIESNFHVAFS